MKLQTLKPSMQRLAPTLPRLQAPTADSWRAGLTTAQRGYGGKWQRARLEHLQAHPLCEPCDQVGRVTAGTVVDHKVAHRGDKALFWQRSNWRTMCKPCHDAKREAEERAGAAIAVLARVIPDREALETGAPMALAGPGSA